MSDFQRHLDEQMKNPAFAAEYKSLELQYAFAKQMIAARLEKGLTQKELAKIVGTSQANISKLEHGTMNPSMEMVQRVADGLGFRISITLG